MLNARAGERSRYRIDFALIVLTGNLTRYKYVRPVVEADADVTTRWYPIRTWVEGDWLRFLPGALRLRARHMLDSWRIFIHRPADGLVIHALETYSLYGFWHAVFRLKTVIVCNPDDAFRAEGPISRWLLDRAVRRTALFVPFSDDTRRLMISDHPEIADRTVTIHPGLPLQDWPQRTEPAPSERFRLLFVGGNSLLKGIEALLDAYEQALHTSCELDVATQRAYLPPAIEERLRAQPGVTLHLDLEPGSSELQRLFRDAGAFVLPTRADRSPWVALEAMATGVPVIISGVGGIPEMVKDGETGLLIQPDRPDQIIAAVRRLEESSDLIDRLVKQGRAHVEEHFDVRRNTTRLLALTERLIDAQRAGRRPIAAAREVVSSDRQSA